MEQLYKQLAINRGDQIAIYDSLMSGINVTEGMTKLQELRKQELKIQDQIRNK